MKKLICEQDIRELIEKGRKCCEVDKTTIITPSARDAADAAGITFRCVESHPEHADLACSSHQITPELVLSVVQGLIARGQLSPDFCEKLLSAQLPYSCEKDQSGLKLVRGNTVRLDECSPGNPKVRYQELINTDDSRISSGILEIDHDAYQRTQDCDENDYILEGSLMVTINGKRYIAHQGDCLFIPRGTTVVMGSPDAYCKVFCNACPSR